MHTTITRGLLTSAAVSVLASATPAMAQHTRSTQLQAEYDQSVTKCQTTIAQRGAEAFFEISHMVPGVPLECDDLASLKIGEPVIISTFNNAGLREVILEHGVDSDEVREFIDDKLSKEGENFRIIVRFGGHVYVVDRTKGVDHDSNLTTVNVYIIANGSNGIPVYSHSAQGANWQSMFAAAALQTGSRVIADASAIGLSRLTAPRVQQGPAQQFFIEGGQGGTAAAQAVQYTDVDVDSNIAANFSNLLNAGGCGTGTTCAPASYQPQRATPNPAPMHDNNRGQGQ